MPMLASCREVDVREEEEVCEQRSAEERRADEDERMCAERTWRKLEAKPLPLSCICVMVASIGVVTGCSTHACTMPPIADDTTLARSYAQGNQRYIVRAQEDYREAHRDARPTAAGTQACRHAMPRARFDAGSRTLFRASACFSAALDCLEA